MPRKGENIYKRKDGRWEARFIDCYKDRKPAETNETTNSIDILYSILNSQSKKTSNCN